MADIQFEIMMTATDLSLKSNKGWVKQLNLVKWGDRDPVWDIRSWHYPEGASVPDKMSKGVSLSKEEMDNLLDYTVNHWTEALSRFEDIMGGGNNDASK